MPSKISMYFSNGNPSIRQILDSNKATKVVNVPKANPTALNSPIIARINNIKPGCSSCGRK